MTEKGGDSDRKNGRASRFARSSAAGGKYPEKWICPTFQGIYQLAEATAALKRSADTSLPRW